MKDVKVLGPGCKRCGTTAEMVQTRSRQARRAGQDREGDRLRRHRRLRHRLDARHRHRRQGRACGRPAEAGRPRAVAGGLSRSMPKKKVSARPFLNTRPLAPKAIGLSAAGPRSPVYELGGSSI